MTLEIIRQKIKEAKEKKKALDSSWYEAEYQCNVEYWKKNKKSKVFSEARDLSKNLKELIESAAKLNFWDTASEISVLQAQLYIAPYSAK